MNTTNISMAVSPRYQLLTKNVLERLPRGWHKDRIIRLEESREMVQLTHGWPAVICAAKLQFKAEQAWIVTLYTASLDALSDDSVRWILAREFGRVRSGDRQPWERKSNGTPIQEKADALAIEWGFSLERQRFEQEYLLARAS